MMLTESCGCGASLTLETAESRVQREGVTVGEDTPLDAPQLQRLDEFRAIHAPCRTDERARIIAEAYVPAPSSTYIVNGDPADARADIEALTEREANQRRRAERAEAIVSRLDGWSAGSAPEGRTVWPYTTPSGYVWETPVTYDDLRATATNATLAGIEGAAGNEHAPAPTWDMLGLVFGELSAVVRQVAETLAAGDTGSEYHAWHELLAIAEGRSEHVLPADVGMSASTLRRIDELRRQAVARIEAERDAD